MSHGERMSLYGHMLCVSSTIIPGTQETCPLTTSFADIWIFSWPLRFRLLEWVKMNQHSGSIPDGCASHFDSFVEGATLVMILVEYSLQITFQRSYCTPSSPPLRPSVLWRTALPTGRRRELHPAESMKWLKFHNHVHMCRVYTDVWIQPILSLSERLG